MPKNLDAVAATLAQHQIAFVQNEPMSRHTTFLVGGPAALFIQPATVAEIALAQRLCRENALPLLPLGRGSNLLVADKGLPYAVLHLCEGFCGITQVEASTLTALSGTKLSALCQYAAKAGLTGLECFYGIPGSVGGGVYMNAGAYGGELSAVVRSVTFLDGTGQERTLSGNELEYRYRHSVFSGKDWVILSATVALTPGDPAKIQQAMEDFMNRRRDKQPLEYGSAGSTFKRPAGAYAAALIDQCGLKGFTIGGAQVSEKHAGFVVNRGGATAGDVHAVMEHIAKTVLAQTGYLLEPEIMILP